MKKLIFILLFLNFGLESFEQGKLDSAHIFGKLENLNILQVYLGYKINTKSIQDSAPVINGRFSFDIPVGDPSFAFLSNPERKGVRFILEAGKIKMSLNSKSFRDIKIIGGPIQKEYNQFNNLLKKETYPLDSLFELYKIVATKRMQPKMDSLEVLMKPLQKKMNSMTIEYIANHPASFLSLIYLNRIVSGNMETYALQEKLFKGLDTVLHRSYTGKVVDYILSFRKKTQIGAPAIEFTTNDAHGKPVSLSDFRGKYVLLDFWASWCVPCRIQNPEIVKAYNTYKKDGFTVLGVSLDTHKERWEKAIIDDKLTWTQLCDFKGFLSDGVQKYFIRSIPTSYLIDPEGIIIGKNLRGEDLDAKLAEIFKRQPLFPQKTNLRKN